MIKNIIIGIIILLLASLLINYYVKKTKFAYQPFFGESSAVTRKQEYIFAVHPLHNPQLIFETYQPLMNYINMRSNDFYLNLETSKDYADFENKLLNHKFSFALPNPYQSVVALKYGYKIFGKMGDDELFKGIILIRKDSDIKNIGDLRKKIISFPSKTALAAAMMPKLFFKNKGLNVEKEATCVYVGSQESSIMNVYLKKSSAAVTWVYPWNNFKITSPDMANELQVKWETEALLNNALVVSNNVTKKHLEFIAQELFNLQTTKEGRAVLQKINLSHFESVIGTGYQEKVNNFLTKYKQAFGMLPLE